MYKELRYTWYISNTNNMIYRILNRLNKQRLPISIKSLFLDVRISSVSSAGLRCFVQLEWLAGSVHHVATMTFTLTWYRDWIKQLHYHDYCSHIIECHISNFFFKFKCILYFTRNFEELVSWGLLLDTQGFTQSVAVWNHCDFSLQMLVCLLFSYFMIELPKTKFIFISNSIYSKFYKKAKTLSEESIHYKLTLLLF